MGRIGNVIDLIRNMGWRYVRYRGMFELTRRSGLLKKKFPTSPTAVSHVSLEDWRRRPTKFFFNKRADITVPMRPSAEIEANFRQILSGKLLLFNSVLTDLGTKYDWVTNPDTGYRYDIKKHWTEIADLSREAGDIKYTWEKSRFAYLYDIIRYDHHFGADNSTFVFGEILSWIDHNPINQGPNYRCSQEMSLRVLNWTFALHFYSDSPALTTAAFDKIQHVIYWHLHHIYNNINFSRIAVRNNHAITETLTLYLAGIFYPQLPDAAVWRQKGKEWFEQEIAYQVYEDGTFLQFSMNYHRVVAQLLTWGIRLSELNGDKLNETVYDRARRSVHFLRTCMADENGMLPNYGANDGALFFKLNNDRFRDFRPQLQALATVLRMDIGLPTCEDTLWYGQTAPMNGKWVPSKGIHKFIKGGYYVIREAETITFVRCGNHKDRPLQADNLHVDIWYKGENIMIDAGSYKYNTDERTARYFSGTESHNTVMLDDKDQMLKGGRFIWYHWTQCKEVTTDENYTAYIFSGTIRTFTYLNKHILHKRTIIKKKGIAEWEVRDELMHTPRNTTMHQLWHSPMTNPYPPTLSSKNDEKKIAVLREEGWASSLYGQKEKTQQYRISTESKTITTVIKV
jgi:Heparinase II/III-like protein/Heparinase II/III N-terminus